MLYLIPSCGRILVLHPAEDAAGRHGSNAGTGGGVAGLRLSPDEHQHHRGELRHHRARLHHHMCRLLQPQGNGHDTGYTESYSVVSCSRSKQPVHLFSPHAWIYLVQICLVIIPLCVKLFYWIWSISDKVKGIFLECFYSQICWQRPTTFPISYFYTEANWLCDFNVPY